MRTHITYSVNLTLTHYAGAAEWEDLQCSACVYTPQLQDLGCQLQVILLLCMLLGSMMSCTDDGNPER